MCDHVERTHNYQIISDLDMIKDIKTLILDFAFDRICGQCRCNCGNMQTYYSIYCIDCEKKYRCFKKNCNLFGVWVAVDGIRHIGIPTSDNRIMYNTISQGKASCSLHLCIYTVKIPQCANGAFTFGGSTQYINQHCNRLAVIDGGYCNKHNDDFSSFGFF